MNRLRKKPEQKISWDYPFKFAWRMEDTSTNLYNFNNAVHCTATARPRGILDYPPLRPERGGGGWRVEVQGGHSTPPPHTHTLNRPRKAHTPLWENIKPQNRYFLMYCRGLHLDSAVFHSSSYLPFNHQIIHRQRVIILKMSIFWFNCCLSSNLFNPCSPTAWWT